MRKAVNIILKHIILLGILLSLILLLTSIMENKESSKKWGDFFEQANEYDILFAGNSHIMTTVSPTQLWTEYGYSSFNIATPSSTMPNTYWTIMNALDYSNPKLIVLDCYFMNMNEKISPLSFSYMHSSWDAVPLSINKIKAVCDLIPDPIAEQSLSQTDDTETQSRMALLWNYGVYHSRWNSLSKSDFEIEKYTDQGATINLLHCFPDHETNDTTSLRLEENYVGVTYLKRIIEECQSRDIDIMLVYLPFPAAEEHLKSANTMMDIASEYEISAINFLNLDVVNYQTDCNDSSSHLNGFGAEKITSYLGAYISDNYHIENHVGDVEHQYWNEICEKNQTSYYNLLYTQNKLVNYLMAVKYSHADSIIEVKDKSLFDDDFYINIFANMGVDTSLLSSQTDYIILQDGGQKTVVLNNFKENGSSLETDLGTFTLWCTETEYALYCGEKEFMISNIVSSDRIYSSLLSSTPDGEKYYQAFSE